MKYFYKTLFRYLSVYIRPTDKVAEIDPRSGILSDLFKNIKFYFFNPNLTNNKSKEDLFQDLESIRKYEPDYILLVGNIHYERDIQATFKKLHQVCSSHTRLVVIHYSSLWKPMIRLATILGLRRKTPEQNWITREDIAGIAYMADFEPVIEDGKIIIPVYIPIISNLINRYIAPLPFFRLFCMVNIFVARPIFNAKPKELSVSIIVPARNEEGNIEDIVKRIPKMGANDELIFIEGNSTDKTWQKIEEIYIKYKGQKNIIIAKQEGKGKGDAVRKGFAMASKDILMILDADMTVPPESLPLFYEAIRSDKGEFINGSRLVYPMENKAMRLLNMIVNKFFAVAFSYVMGQKLKDTLCGTKVITKENYLKISFNRSYFGDFDPFGDFDLIFGAARLCLKIREIPVRYTGRTYGVTNINRWRDGSLLLKMLIYASKMIKFV